MITDHRQAVDEVRAWLVSIRGGSPFLSSADGWRLVRWLDDGVPVSAIARAIERASAARRARRARRPLGLSDAGRYLEPERPVPSAPTVKTERLRAAIRALDPADPDLDALAAGIGEGSGTSDEVFRRVLQEFRAFYERMWSSLRDAEREVLLAEARAGYGDWLADLGDSAQLALVEEAARDALRARYPRLGAELAWDALQPEEPDPR